MCAYIYIYLYTLVAVRGLKLQPTRKVRTYSYEAKQKDKQQKCLQRHKRKHLLKRGEHKNQQQWEEKNHHMIDCRLVQAALAVSKFSLLFLENRHKTYGGLFKMDVKIFSSVIKACMCQRVIVLIFVSQSVSHSFNSGS